MHDSRRPPLPVHMNLQVCYDGRSPGSIKSDCESLAVPRYRSGGPVPPALSWPSDSDMMPAGTSRSRARTAAGQRSRGLEPVS